MVRLILFNGQQVEPPNYVLKDDSHKLHLIHELQVEYCSVKKFFPTAPFYCNCMCQMYLV